MARPLVPILAAPVLPVLMNVLEDRKAEPDNSFVPFSRGWKFRRVNRAKHVMYAADKQLVFVAEVRVKG